jgi:DNA transposition AAA+ family ATPase
MNADLGKTEFTAAEIATLRARLKQHKGDGKLSWADIEAQTGVAASTIAAWTTDKYAGDNESIAAKIHRFFLQYAEQEELAQHLPTEPGFQPTLTATRIMRALTMAQLGDMVAIATPPGLGKTASCRQYHATRQQVWLVTAAPSIRGAPTLLIAILRAMGVKDAKGTPQALSAQIRERVTGSRGLIIIDEAQHLSSQALEELRSIHDETDVGVALVGDENLIINIRKFTQLYSRLGLKHTQPRALAEDVRMLAAAWGISSGAELAFVLEIGRKPGGLRAVTKTIRLARLSADAEGTPLSVGDLRDAFAQNYGHSDAA